MEPTQPIIPESRPTTKPIILAILLVVIIVGLGLWFVNRGKQQANTPTIIRPAPASVVLNQAHLDNGMKAINSENLIAGSKPVIVSSNSFKLTGSSTTSLTQVNYNTKTPASALISLYKNVLQADGYTILSQKTDSKGVEVISASKKTPAVSATVYIKGNVNFITDVNLVYATS